MRTNHLFITAVIGALLLTGCAKSGRETSPESPSTIPASEQAIGFSTYTGRAVTKGATSLNQSFNVEAFLSGTDPRQLYFPSTTYTYASSGSYTGDPVRYWPLETDKNLDFYAVSPLTYTNTSSESVDLTPASDSTIVLSWTDGSTDVSAARVLNAPNGATPAAVALTFGHKLTKVAFTAIGQDQSKKYVISDLTLTANSTSTYSYEEATAPVIDESWTASSDSYIYDYVSSDVIIDAGISSSADVGSAKYLIPNQASTLTAKVKYQVFEVSGGTEVLIGNYSTGIEVSLPTDSWGINKSVVYNLKLGVTASPTPSTADNVITFTANVTDWDADVTVNQNVPPVDLGSTATANCYIVSSAGYYKFKAVQGNSSTSVGTVASAEVLWESFGTSTPPNTGDLIKANVSYADGYIHFSTADTFHEGNAVIAAKDGSDNILWSWHIWLTDAPATQTYNSKTFLDRNLGATSATAGDAGALGLLYQWGRKDPFLGSSSTNSKTETASTITWPAATQTDADLGTVENVTKNPTTFYYNSSYPYDWHSDGSTITGDDDLWGSPKTKYDPCPAGYHVPANGSWDIFNTGSFPWDPTNYGRTYDSNVWYPAAGYRGGNNGTLDLVGSYGYFWSCTPSGTYAFYLYFGSSSVNPSNSNSRASGFSVRCVQD